MKISVITPVYNRADCIEKCMESVSNATKRGLEVEHVICDDGSTDNTVEIIEKYAEQHPHVKLCKLNKNSGPNTARNTAIRNASGEWILILDSDDALAPDSFVNYETIMTQNPDYKHYMFNCDDCVAANEKFGQLKEFHFEDFLFGNVTGDFNHLFLRETALALPFDESLRIYEGVFFLRFYKRVKKMLFSDKVTDLRDRSRDDHVTFTSRKTTNKALEEAIVSAELYTKYFKDDFLNSENGREILDNKLKTIFTYSTFLGQYQRAKKAMDEIRANGLRKPSILIRLIHSLRIGRPIWWVLKLGAKLRWKIRMILGRKEV